MQLEFLERNRGLLSHQVMLSCLRSIRSTNRSLMSHNKPAQRAAMVSQHLSTSALAKSPLDPSHEVCTALWLNGGVS